MMTPDPTFVSVAPPGRGLASARLEALALAAVLTVASHAVPLWWALFVWDRLPGFDSGAILTYQQLWDLTMLGMGLLLALPAPGRNGLCVGRIREHWRGVVVILGVPLLALAVVYPNLPVRPFKDADPSLWLISPLAQDLLFGGIIYGRLEPLFAGRVHPRLPFRWALVIGGIFFAGWHVPNFAAIPAGYVVFQLGYTYLGYLIAGLSRQWTGSILYVTLAHSLGNWIAVVTS